MVVNLDSSLLLLEEALKSKRDALGPGHPGLIHWLQKVGVAYDKAEHYQRAMSLYQEAIDLHHQHEGEVNGGYDYSMLCHNLGVIYYYEEHDYVKAIPLFEEAVAGRRELIATVAAAAPGDAPDDDDDDPDHSIHVSLVSSLCMLAKTHEEMGDVSPAVVDYYEEVLAIRREVLRSNVAGSLYDLAIVHMKRGDHHQALPLLQEAVDITKPSYNLAVYLERMAEVYESIGQASKSRNMYKESQRVWEEEWLENR